MTHGKQFRRILPISQVALAGVFGGLGLWQRNQILSHDYLFGIGWNTTAKFHVWPWPFKFAVVLNLPAFLAGSLLTWPIGALWPELHEAAQVAPSLLLVVALWYWIGSWLDRRCGSMGKTPWVFLAIFTAACLIGALIPIGYIGYLPYGLLVWLVGTVATRRMAKQSPHLCS